MLEWELGALSSRVQGVEAQLQTMNERLLGLEDSLRPLASIDQSLRRLGDAADSLFPRPAAPCRRWPLRPRTRGGLSSPPSLKGRGRRGRGGGRQLIKYCLLLTWFVFGVYCLVYVSKFTLKCLNGCTEKYSHLGADLCSQVVSPLPCALRLSLQIRHMQFGLSPS